MYGLTVCCLNKFSASAILSIVAYVLKHLRNTSVSFCSRPSLKEPSKLYCNVLVIVDILWKRNECLQIATTFGFVSLTFVKVCMHQNTYWSNIIYKGESSAFIHIELQLIELCGYPFYQLTIKFATMEII